jgi:hypothetical protein
MMSMVPSPFGIAPAFVPFHQAGHAPQGETATTFGRQTSQLVLDNLGEMQ